MSFITKGKNNWKFIAIIIALAAFAGIELMVYISNVNSDLIFSTFFIEDKKTDKNMKSNIICTEGAKICPDGSSVVRTGPDCEFAECPIAKKDEISSCLKKYPLVEYKDCVPGKIVDGWRGVILYPNNLDTSNITHHIDAPAPDTIKKAGVASYGTGGSDCQTTWHIKINKEWKEVSQTDFCNFIIDYNSSCNDCLLEWEEGCC